MRIHARSPQLACISGLASAYVQLLVLLQEVLVLVSALGWPPSSLFSALVVENIYVNLKSRSVLHC